MRMIDADALIEAMGEEPYVWTDSAEEIAERNQWLTDMHIIEDAPTIDAVEVVRCKECRYWNTKGCRDGVGECEWAYYMTKPNDYCSCGEREGE